LLDDFARHDVLSGVRSVFSVGPGFGPLEVELMRRGIDVGYAEPYARFADELEGRANAAGVADRIVERHHGEFASAPVNRRYDLVIASFSWQSYVGQRAPLDRALGICASGGQLMIMTADHQSTLYEVFAVPLAPEMDVYHVSSWLRQEGVPHEVRLLPPMNIARDVFLDDHGQLTRTAVGLATFLMHRVDLTDAYFEHLRVAIEAHPEGIERGRGLIVIPAPV
jgi:hypothetical protein